MVVHHGSYKQSANATGAKVHMAGGGDRVSCRRFPMAVEFAARGRKPDFSPVVRMSIGEQTLLVKHAETMVGSRRRGISRPDRELIRTSELPVLLVRSGSLPRSVGVALNPCEAEHDHALNRHLVTVGSTIAALTGTTLHAITVWRTVGETLLRSRVSAEKLQQYRRDARRRAELAAKAALSETEGMIQSSRLHVAEGDPVEQIAMLVTRNALDLLVVGNSARCGISGAMIGNTAERLLPRVDCSLLVVPAEVITKDEAAAQASGE